MSHKIILQHSKTVQINKNPNRLSQLCLLLKAKRWGKNQKRNMLKQGKNWETFQQSNFSSRFSIIIIFLIKFGNRQILEIIGKVDVEGLIFLNDLVAITNFSKVHIFCTYACTCPIIVQKGIFTAHPLFERYYSVLPDVQYETAFHLLSSITCSFCPDPPLVQLH